jgi:hypothetical protein
VDDIEPGNEDEPEREINSRFDVPEEWKVGVYANEVNVWHTPYEFTLDFAAINAAMTGYEASDHNPQHRYGSRSASCLGFSRRSTQR